MGKLVLFLADGTTMDVPLDKERITIGRRADNDVCLPYPAVSGEHAQVVTILADSFLEDLGSTNGTLVNGKADRQALPRRPRPDRHRPPAAHVRVGQRRQGRCRCRPISLRHQLRGLAREGRAGAAAAADRGAGRRRPAGRRRRRARSPLLADIERDVPLRAAAVADAACRAVRRRRRMPSRRTSRKPTRRRAPAASPRRRAARERAAPTPAPAPAQPARRADARPTGPSVRVLSGASHRPHRAVSRDRS